MCGVVGIACSSFVKYDMYLKGHYGIITKFCGFVIFYLLN